LNWTTPQPSNAAVYFVEIKNGFSNSCKLLRNEFGGFVLPLVDRETGKNLKGNSLNIVLSMLY
jgi:hypothetical protein